ncbi:hypothetical protein BAC_A0022 (plasmid) [Bacillus anthracis str. A0488]|uniref:Uncharacterized protein n=1 Tax=Bacillus anthracis TaxID=1392 RepID=Q6F014_BACAN|nr:hypothetical protein BX_A0001 [Bacillus anthracis str. A2012]AAT28742.2 hypothetical protein GBAA_pXO1_0001 [Bacillus anthracis str. 'Ames Ancestor']ADK08037.1 hypothetical protein BACI_pCIXO100020 [Bacillus cereus biovar anthracis str. CI]EDR16308.1 hypothetical protein BAC_A0022 [Bacillus anthracis str. A0488]EDR85364.1 hypothetical protein BAQ_A0121 [Bacillus anthracis str. A0193]EDR90585.1 hypothetical protein BAH_A0183 [Bacillus anthracis str. A0442]EDS94464.1 hypothetical protein BAK
MVARIHLIKFKVVIKSKKRHSNECLFLWTK